jgi:hypothetical protein
MKKAKLSLLIASALLLTIGALVLWSNESIFRRARTSTTPADVFANLKKKLQNDPKRATKISKLLLGLTRIDPKSNWKQVAQSIISKSPSEKKNVIEFVWNLLDENSDGFVAKQEFNLQVGKIYNSGSIPKHWSKFFFLNTEKLDSSSFEKAFNDFLVLNSETNSVKGAVNIEREREFKAHRNLFVTEIMINNGNQPPKRTYQIGHPVESKSSTSSANTLERSRSSPAVSAVTTPAVIDSRIPEATKPVFSTSGLRSAEYLRRHNKAVGAPTRRESFHNGVHSVQIEIPLDMAYDQEVSSKFDTNSTKERISLVLEAEHSTAAADNWKNLPDVNVVVSEYVYNPVAYQYFHSVEIPIDEAQVGASTGPSNNPRTTTTTSTSTSQSSGSFSSTSNSIPHPSTNSGYNPKFNLYGGDQYTIDSIKTNPYYYAASQPLAEEEAGSIYANYVRPINQDLNAIAPIVTPDPRENLPSTSTVSTSSQSTNSNINNNNNNNPRGFQATVTTFNADPVPKPLNDFSSSSSSQQLRTGTSSQTETIRPTAVIAQPQQSSTVSSSTSSGSFAASQTPKPQAQGNNQGTSDFSENAGLSGYRPATHIPSNTNPSSGYGSQPRNYEQGAYSSTQSGYGSTGNSNNFQSQNYGIPSFPSSQYTPVEPNPQYQQQFESTWNAVPSFTEPAFNNQEYSAPQSGYSPSSGYSSSGRTGYQSFTPSYGSGSRANFEGGEHLEREAPEVEVPQTRGNSGYSSRQGISTGGYGPNVGFGSGSRANFEGGEHLEREAPEVEVPQTRENSGYSSRQGISTGGYGPNVGFGSANRVRSGFTVEAVYPGLIPRFSNDVWGNVGGVIGGNPNIMNREFSVLFQSLDMNRDGHLDLFEASRLTEISEQMEMENEPVEQEAAEIEEQEPVAVPLPIYSPPSIRRSNGYGFRGRY